MVNLRLLATRQVKWRLDPEAYQGLLDRLDAKKRETQANVTQTETGIAAIDVMAKALSSRISENEDLK